jgi:hypothetical protein
MQDTGLLAERLKPLIDYLESEIKAELVRQGHVATGKLRDQIKVALEGNTIVGAANEAFYAKYVDWGRRPGGKRVPIGALVAWIQIRGFAQGNNAVKMAWAIQYSIWKNGIPTNKDEGKTKFVTRTLERGKDKILTDVRSAVNYWFNVELTNIIRQVKTT